MTDAPKDSRDAAMRAREAVLLAFEQPALTPDVVFETAMALDTHLKPETVKSAVVSLLNRGELDLGWDGRLRRVVPEPDDA